MGHIGRKGKRSMEKVIDKSQAYVFNMEHPSGYKGRSLSVSDVVEIFLSSGGSEFYYCEPIGFKRIRFGKG